MSQKLENAKGLYIEGINNGNAKEALDKYIGSRYTQHSTGVADGKQGFLNFFLPFLERNPVRDIKVIRSIEDGQYVFVHVHQNLNNGQYYYVTADIFDTDNNDKIIEHWDAIQEEVRETVSGRFMVDGPTEIEDLDKTEANRTFITNFMNDILVGGKVDKLGDYISSEQYDQHNPTVADGIDGLIKHGQEFVEKGINAQYLKVHKILVQGNFGVALSHVKINDDDWCYFDIFRVKDGKIVEHWDVQEQIAPKEKWKNSGKF